MVQGVRHGVSGSRWRRAGTILVVAVAVGLLQACSMGEPEPERPSPTIERPAAGPEAEPTEERPEEPVAPIPRTGTPDEYDAVEAAEFFVDLYVYVLRTGDTRQWDERSREECGFCAGVRETAAEFEARDSRLHPVEFDAEPAQFVGFDEVMRFFAAEVAYASAPADVIGADGEVIESFGRGAGHLLFEMAYGPQSGWQMWSVIESDESVL